MAASRPGNSVSCRRAWPSPRVLKYKPDTINEIRYFKGRLLRGLQAALQTLRYIIVKARTWKSDFCFALCFNTDAVPLEKHYLCKVSVSKLAWCQPVIVCNTYNSIFPQKTSSFCSCVYKNLTFIVLQDKRHYQEIYNGSLY